MAWIDALIGGGAALAGVGLQQAFSRSGEQRRYTRDQEESFKREQHLALVDVVKSGRRVQRALVDLETGAPGADAEEVFAREVDRLTEAVATVRLMVTDADVLEEANRFESQAKRLEHSHDASDQGSLRLTPLIDAIRRFEGIA